MSSILEITNLIVRYKIKNKEIHAVEDVSLSVNKEEFVGIVGESGSGKSTMAHAIVKLLPPNAYIKNGKVNLLGYDLTNMTDEEVMKVRWKD
ncbi:MAG: peptide/nickel transport system ATP-binding protein, partial [Clostridia bacterium]|nr:peptide/nickel transport system ATP-binding protein [Clostridia bacterium]